jgi:hypothetical protein
MEAEEKEQRPFILHPSPRLLACSDTSSSESLFNQVQWQASAHGYVDFSLGPLTGHAFFFLLQMTTP